MGLPLLASPAVLAGASATERRFVVVVCGGGWDTTRVFSPAFGVAAMEPNARRVVSGGLDWVSHPDRPAVDRFFEHVGPRSVILDGLRIEAAGHPAATRVLLDGEPDWPARLAAARADLQLPGVLMGVPGYPGEARADVVSLGASGQLGELSGDRLAARSELPVARLPGDTRVMVERHLARREAERTRPWSLAAARADRIGSLPSWIGGFDTDAAQITLISRLLGEGRTRVVNTGWRFGQWDSHTDNDGIQSDNFEALFGFLEGLVTSLAATPGPDGLPLDRSTVVVVLSEMGRTPWVNDEGGKDHWPTTAALVVGPGLEGGRRIGTTDEGFAGSPINLDTGEPDPDGVVPDAALLATSLLGLGGLAKGRGIRAISG